MYKKGRVNSNSRIISTDEDPSLRIESSAIINLLGVSTKLKKYKKDMVVFSDATVKAPKKLYLARVLAASGKHAFNFSWNLYLVTVNV